MKIATRDLTLRAGDLMARNPLSISESATIRDAARFLLEKRISAAPVINQAGRAIGVVALTDIVRHSISAAEGASLDLPVREVMNDEVLFVRPETPIREVVEDLIKCDVKRLFVADENDVMVGVISTVDLLDCQAARPAPDPRADAAPIARADRLAPKRPRRRAKRTAVPTGSDIVMAMATADGEEGLE